MFVHIWTFESRTPLSKQMGRIAAACAQDIASRNSSASSVFGAFPPGNPRNGPSRAGPALGSTRAGVNDDVVYTNFLNIGKTHSTLSRFIEIQQNMC